MSNTKDNGPQAQAAALFGTGIRYVPGFGYVGAPVPNGVAGGALGDDASVMMISGLGASDDQRQVAVNEATGAVESVKGAGYRLGVALKMPVTIGSVTLPLWVWLLGTGTVLSTAAYYFLFKKK